MDILEISGTEYEVGVKIGKKFRTYFQEKIGKYEQKLKYDEVKNILENVREKIELKAPKCLEEIYGRADGAKVSRDALLLMFCPELFGAVNGCSTIIVKKNEKEILFAHNEDDLMDGSETVCLVKYNIGNNWVVGYTKARQLVGGAFAWNNYGIVISCNYIYSSMINIDNVSRYVLSREILRCKNIKEIINKCKEIKTASGFSVNVLDLKENKAINIEVGTSSIQITNIENKYGRANHYINKKSYHRVIKNQETLNRQEKITELLKNIKISSSDMKTLVNILNYEGDEYNNSIFKDFRKYPELNQVMTTNTFTINSANKKIVIYNYLNMEILNIDYDSFNINKNKMEK